MKKKDIIIHLIIGITLFAITVLYFLTKNGVIFPNIHELLGETTFVARLIRIGGAVAVGAFFIILSNFLVKLHPKKEDQTFVTAKLLIGNAIKYIAIIACVLAILSAFGVDTSTLVTASGILALIVGLGCQALVSDIVAGIFMIFEGDIKVGDVVVINGWRGTVRQVGLRRTKIEDAVGNINIVNNSSISNIINNTKELSYAVCEVGIEYNESIERVEAILAENLGEFKKRIPTIVEGPFYKGVQSLGESAVVIKFIAKCTEENKFQVERDINRELKILFDKHNINIPFNQIVVNYRENENKQKDITKTQKEKSESFIQEQKELAGKIEDTNN